MRIELAYKPSFVRDMNKLPELLGDEALQKIELFRDTENHQLLRVHKLHGRLRDYYSFSVNYRYRIVFEWADKREEATLLAIGDHALYG